MIACKDDRSTENYSTRQSSLHRYLKNRAFCLIERLDCLFVSTHPPLSSIILCI